MEIGPVHSPGRVIKCSKGSARGPHEHDGPYDIQSDVQIDEFAKQPLVQLAETN